MAFEQSLDRFGEGRRTVRPGEWRGDSHADAGFEAFVHPLCRVSACWGSLHLHLAFQSMRGGGLLTFCAAKRAGPVVT